MYVVSSAYENGAEMPARFATRQVQGGTGASVPLAWGDEPTGTRSYVVEMIDHHPVAHEWLHWLVVDIPAKAHAIDEGVSGTPAMPAGALELVNRGGRPGYGGPQPPVGSGVHDYETTVLALDVPRLDVRADATPEEVSEAVRGHVLASASVVGRFGR
jgi:Raf kinase inhibitor-like YbhB/YbcL family protein